MKKKGKRGEKNGEGPYGPALKEGRKMKSGERGALRPGRKPDPRTGFPGKNLECSNLERWIGKGRGLSAKGKTWGQKKVDPP